MRRIELNKVCVFVGGGWSYTTLPQAGTCRIDGEAMQVTLTISRVGGDREVWPDVRDVDAWFAELLAKPCVIEELLAPCEKQFSLREWSCEITGATAGHGPLTVRSR